MTTDDSMRPPVYLAVLLLFVLMPVAFAGGQEIESVELRPQWKAGQTSRFEFWNERREETTVAFGDRTQTTGTTVESEGAVTWTVDQLRADGGAVCTMTLDWMTATITPDEGEVSENDSRRGKGDTEFIHDLLKAMVGKPLKVTVNGDGSIEKVSGIDAMRDAGENPEIVPDELDFQETASDLASLPFVPVSVEVGDGWDADYRWSHQLGFVDQPWSYRLSRIEEIAGLQVAVVDGESKRMKLDPSTFKEELPAEAPPVKVRLTEGSAESQVLFDLSRREAVGRNGTTRTSVRIEIPLPDGRKVTRILDETNRSQVLRVGEE